VERLRTNPDLLERGPARIAHLAPDSAVDAYFPVLDRLDAFGCTIKLIEERRRQIVRIDRDALLGVSIIHS